MMESFEIKFKLNCPAQGVYDAWMDSDTHSAMTGGAKAVIDPRKGGAFSAWDGYISGVTMELIPGKKILQRWRTTDFDEHQGDSRVEITFEDIEGGSLVKIFHSELPPGQAKEYKEGWQDYYFDPMEKFFAQ